MAEPSRAPWPQEIRIAMTMTGGSSLAVWMGGIASETSALLSASRSKEPGPYRKLLDLLNATVSVDVLTGTSAGGVNAACLGLAEAYQSSPEILRDIWITAGSLDNLIRDPGEREPRSLLDGDRVLLAGIKDAFAQIVEAREDPPANPDVTVLLTGTMIDGETVRYDDALGNLVRDSEHRLLFRFDGSLWTKDAIGPLALAARSTASFPGVFELSHLPVHENGADELHPDLAPYTEVARSHWLADGGVLLNKPLRPALREIFERWSQKDVRRLLLYVVPTDAGEAGRIVPNPADPPLLVNALRHVVSAVMNQSISTELEDLTAHNDAVGRTHDTRVSLAGLAATSGQGLVSRRLMDDYRDRRVQEDATAIVREATRRLDRDDAGAGEQWASGMSRNLREAAVKGLRDSLPGDPPGDECPLETVILFRTTALDDAVATGLQLVNAGFRLAPGDDQVAALNAGRTKLHDALRLATRAERLTGWVAGQPAPEPGVELSDWVGALAVRWAKLGQTAKLAEAWPMVASALRELSPVLRALATGQETVLPAGLEGGRADAVTAITTLLDWLGLPGDKPDPVLYARLLTLHVATRGLVTQPPSVDQRVDLVQVSADSRTLLDMKRGRATEKLTGMQADYFGAFYKASWRASDWMWGRIDGVGWLMQCLLDPHRLAYISAASIKETFEAIGWQPPRQQDGLSEAEVTALREQLTEELGFLGLDADLKPVERTANLPSSLPVTAMVLARSRQLELAASELPIVAKYARSDAETAHGNGKPSSAFCALMDNPPKDPEATQNAFKACQVSAEKLEGERGSMLLTKTLVKAGAAGINAASVAMPMPKSVKPAVAFSRAAGRAAWWITEGAAKLGKPWNLLAALITVLAGIVVGGQADTVLQWIGLPVAVGALLFLLVAIFTARRTWRRLFGLVWVAVAACLLFAAYIPPIREHFFAWLATLMTGWKQGEAPLWWLVVAAFLILPAVTTPLAAAARLITRKPAKRK